MVGHGGPNWTSRAYSKRPECRGRSKRKPRQGPLKGGMQCLAKSPVANSWPEPQRAQPRRRSNFQPGHRTSRAVQARPAHRQDRPACPGRHPDGAGHRHVPEGEELHAWPAARSSSFSADTGGNPAGTKTKAQELVERDKVDTILGPLAAFELLAITDYVAQQQDAAAQPRRRRGHDAAPAQSVFHPRLGDLCAGHASDGRLRRQGTEAQARRSRISEDFAFGHEQMGGFQQTFEDTGGKILKKLWPPLVTPDYTPYVAQIERLSMACARALPARTRCAS